MSIAAFALVVLINVNVADKGDYTVSADGREIGRFRIEGKETGVAEHRLSVPAGSKRLTVERSTSLPVVGTKVGRRSKTFDLISVAGITKPLREERPVVALGGLVAETDALLREIGSEYSSNDIGLSFGPKQSQTAIAEAEARLGYKLDPELAGVLTTLGPVKYGDSGMVEAKDLVTTERQFMRLWGNEENVSGDALALYRASTMIWVEVGDGYGAMIHAPKPPDHCNGAAAYWKIHQDTIGDPHPVSNSQGRCGTLSDVLMWVIGADLLEQVEDDGKDNQLLVDPTMPNAFPVWLETDRDANPRLRPDWSRLQ
ncbi:hypothetical protein [Hyphomicrobium sp. LHD-15]|uniref:hypothetical protein n=1 Tax=Hyphomicrobium sp. LHD-15 TaxID=3072142 RepID=UPI0028101F12|nr:hypothetical protein [Hyphomicrobium sp. LHD-15]MDQ8698342.1 hypothetical protein [Hyphomicrobium sp. LHD-15]